MPGPFPGMDPYMEEPSEWRGFHQRFMTYVSDDLNVSLPPEYVAKLDVRVYMSQPDRSIFPDIIVVEHPTQLPKDSGAGRTALAVAVDPAWVLKVYPVEVREAYIDIVRTASPEEVITNIELLSPSNKAAGSEGQRLYQTKQREVLDSHAHLIEIDLLRSGAHTVAAPLEMLRARGQWDYLVSLNRGDDRSLFEVWPVTLQQRLPRVRVPLAQGDPDVALDLQPLLDRCYDAGRYRTSLDYRKAPPPPALRVEDREWVDQLLREKGLRPAAGGEEQTA